MTLSNPLEAQSMIAIAFAELLERESTTATSTGSWKGAS